MNENSGWVFDDSLNLNQNDVPYTLLNKGSRMEIISNKKIHFDGSYKILEYSNEELKIKRNKLNIIFSGTSLKIRNVEKNSFLLTGTINNILFE